MSAAGVSAGPAFVVLQSCAVQSSFRKMTHANHSATALLFHLLIGRSIQFSQNEKADLVAGVPAALGRVRLLVPSAK